MMMMMIYNIYIWAILPNWCKVRLEIFGKLFVLFPKLCPYIYCTICANVLCFCCLFLHDFLTFFCSLLGKSLIHFNFPSSFRFLFLSLSFLKYSWCFTGSSLTLCQYSLSLSVPLFPFGILVSYDSFSPEQFVIVIRMIYMFTI